MTVGRVLQEDWVYTVHLSIYMLCCGFWWSGLTAFFFYHVFSFEKSRRCDDNQQITVSHFGEHKRPHLESSKQNYYIISLRAIIKTIFTALGMHESTPGGGHGRVGKVGSELNYCLSTTDKSRMKLADSSYFINVLWRTCRGKYKRTIGRRNVD